MVMSLFDSIKVPRLKSNVFNLSHERKVALQMAFLVPILCMDVLPGDKIRKSTSMVVRTLALLSPVMHRVRISVDDFFVPNRLVWSSWEDFITGGRDGLLGPSFPTFTPSAVNGRSPGYLKDGSLLDHLGFPTMRSTGTYQAEYNAAGFTFSALPLRAYLLVYDQYYRNETIEASVLTANFKADGPVTGTDLDAILALRLASWEKDYFTSQMPTAQRGNPVSVTGSVVAPTTGFSGNRTMFRDSTTGNVRIPASTSAVQTSSSGGDVLTTDGVSAARAYYDPNGSLISSFTIAALRVANALQIFLERNLYAGGRYIEYLLSQFAVQSSDARLQRAEFLGGSRTDVAFSEVLQTAPASGGSTPLAQMGGHGISAYSGGEWSRFFEEHGTLLSILRIVPNTQYQDNIPRMWQKRVQTDFYAPAFANLGEQGVAGMEVWCNWGVLGGATGALALFGYQNRWAEHKTMLSTAHGQMKDSLVYWHFGRVFNQAPLLNLPFIASIQNNNPFAVVGVENIVCHIAHRIQAKRRMPYHVTPRL